MVLDIGSNLNAPLACVEMEEAMGRAAFQWVELRGSLSPVPEDQEGKRMIFIPQQGNS